MEYVTNLPDMLNHQPQVDKAWKAMYAIFATGRQAALANHGLAGRYADLKRDQEALTEEVEAMRAQMDKQTPVSPRTWSHLDTDQQYQRTTFKTVDNENIASRSRAAILQEHSILARQFTSSSLPGTSEDRLCAFEKLNSVLGKRDRAGYESGKAKGERAEESEDEEEDDDEEESDEERSEAEEQEDEDEEEEEDEEEDEEDEDEDEEEEAEPMQKRQKVAAW